MPFVIHDLQDSQMFALAQAAGRAGFPVVGSSWPVEPWTRHSRYIRRVVSMPCLGENLAGVYALRWRDAGLSGVWLPAVDDTAAFTARYAPMLRKLGMRFLVAGIEAQQQANAVDTLPDCGLAIPWMRQMPAGELMDAADTLAYPLIDKSRRHAYRRLEDADQARRHAGQMLAEVGPEYRHHLQQYIPGPVERMASAMLLFDAGGRPVRGFTGRRLRVSDSRREPFGETTAACAEWIPALYEGARNLLARIGWQGFAEVECKRAEDGRWYVMEINPRTSGWLCLAEADGAGFLQAYHRLCTDDLRLEEACLQRSRTGYRRLIATCYHEPDWAGCTSPHQGRWQTLGRTWAAIRAGRQRPMQYGAWDGRDLRASLTLAWASIRRTRQALRLRRQQGL
jgi:hypothetical protein